MHAHPPFRERGDELVRVSCPGRRLHFAARRVGVAVLDVVEDARRKQRWLLCSARERRRQWRAAAGTRHTRHTHLRHNCHVCPQPRGVVFSHRYPIHQDIASGGIVQSAQRRLGSRRQGCRTVCVVTYLINKDTLVDLPEPLGPTRATTSPGLAVNDTWLSTCTSLRVGYEKHTSCGSPANAHGVSRLRASPTCERRGGPPLAHLELHATLAARACRPRWRRQHLIAGRAGVLIHHNTSHRRVPVDELEDSRTGPERSHEVAIQACRHVHDLGERCVAQCRW